MLEIESIKNPIIVYYQRVMGKDAERDNLESSIKIRNEINLDIEQLMPMTSFYCEKKLLLGSNPSSNYKQLLCQHDNLMAGYYDVYPQKRYKNLLYEQEKKMIDNKQSLKLERSLFDDRYFTYNRVVLGTTMIPKPIGEYLLESVFSC
jgi:hypothetical protein